LLAVALLAPPGMGWLKGIATIHTAQVQYFSSYGRFAASLQELGPPASGSDTASAAGLIERDLASGEKGGYKLQALGHACGLYDFGYSGSAGRQQQILFFGPVGADSCPRRTGTRNRERSDCRRNRALAVIELGWADGTVKL
jgi:hypothetical protein